MLDILATYRRVTTPTRALIVDDSATVRRIIRRVLASSIFDIEATDASDGAAALAFCESGDFDVVFLDCNMPGLDGLETLERLRQRDANVKAIMITGDRNEAWRRLALARGAVAFLYKPFYPADIDRELHAIFGLPMPELAAVEPMRFAKTDPLATEIAQAQWSG